MVNYIRIFVLIGNTVMILCKEKVAQWGGTRVRAAPFIPSGPVLGAEDRSIAPDETGIIYSSNK